MPNVFANNVGEDIWQAIDQAAYEAGMDKRNLIMGTIAHLAGIEHADRNAAVKAWRRYRDKVGNY